MNQFHFGSSFSGRSLARTAVVVVDMQNDFGAEGGMFHRAGIDISSIRQAIIPTARVLAAARKSGVKIVYLKMEFRSEEVHGGLEQWR